MLDCPPPPLRQPSTSEATPMKLLSASKESLDAASALSFPFTNAVDLLVKVTDRLELPIWTVATALSFLHQFQDFCHQTNDSGRLKEESVLLESIDPSLVVLVCIDLACKSTEALRKLRDMINVTYTYWKIRDSVGHLEFLILRIIRFQLHVETAYPWIVRIIKGLFCAGDEDGAFRRDVHVSGKATGQLAIAIMNDVYRLSNLSNKYSARSLASAAVYLSLRCLKMDLPTEFDKWCGLWGNASGKRIEEIVTELLQVLQTSSSLTGN